MLLVEQSLLLSLELIHREHRLHCYEPCRASDGSTAVKILDRRAAIDSLCCSDEQGVFALQALRQIAVNVGHMRACWQVAAEFHRK